MSDLCCYIKKMPAIGKLSKRYGSGNLEIEDLRVYDKVCPYSCCNSYRVKFSCRILVVNRAVYTSVESRPKGLSAIGGPPKRTCAEYQYLAVILKLDEDGRLFVMKKEDWEKQNLQKACFIGNDISEIIVNVWNNNGDILLSMKDGGILYGDMDAFSKTWDIKTLKTFDF